MRSIDRLLRHFLSQFIRRGSITFTTSSGVSFTCGDGTGKPVSVRFITAEAERHLLLDPELAIGRFLTQMPGRFEPAKGPAALHGVVIVVDPESGRASQIRRLSIPA